MSADGPAGAPASAPTKSSQTSSWWEMYRDSLKQQYNPFRAPRDPEVAKARGYSTDALLAATTPFFQIQSTINSKSFGQGGNPDEGGQVGSVLNKTNGKADRYMSESVRRQYIMGSGISMDGVYNVGCTEGGTKGQADEARVLSLARGFRQRQRSTSQKYGDYFAARQQALNDTGGCDYEEKLVLKFPRTARNMVRGLAESKGACVRYQEGESEEEKYMARSVDRQMKMRAVPMGVYDKQCLDGTTRGMAEFSRVQALAARFRARQASKNAKTQGRYDAAKYARNNYGHECGYEEAYYNKFKAVASAMRPTTDRY